MARNNNQQSINSKSSNYLTKQKAQNSQQFQQTQSLMYECQPLLGQHSECNDVCQTFHKLISNQGQINLRIQKFKPISLTSSKIVLQNLIALQQSNKINTKKKENNKNRIHCIKNINKNPYLSFDQRLQIQKLQKEGFKNTIISGMLQVSISQVKQNQIRLKISKCKEQIQITKRQQHWIIEQGSSQSNSMLFNAQTFHAAFLEQFPKSKLSVSQFRNVLLQQNLRYRIPSLKPFSFFNKIEKEQETKNFISQLCVYLTQNYKLIFIDECSLGNISKFSHRQWHVLGSFKESTQRISSYKYLIGALGDDFFLQFQLFQGTGKAYIFSDFLIQVITKAKEFYNEQNFVLIMDNSRIHKSILMEDIFERVPCIFTPAYRPEFNAIEHMFGWLKRSLVVAQTSTTSQFIFQIHRIISRINNEMMQNWCNSVYKHMLQELDYL